MKMIICLTLSSRTIKPFFRFLAANEPRSAVTKSGEELRLVMRSRFAVLVLN